MVFANSFPRLSHGFAQNLNSKVHPGTINPISTIIDGVICGKIGDGLSIPSVEIVDWKSWDPPILMDWNLMFPHLFLAILRAPVCQTHHRKTIFLVAYPIISYYIPTWNPMKWSSIGWYIPFYPYFTHYIPIISPLYPHYITISPKRPSAHRKSPKLRPVPRWGHVVFNVPKESYLPGGRGQLDASVPSEKAALGANERQILWGIHAILIYNYIYIYII